MAEMTISISMSKAKVLRWKRVQCPFCSRDKCLLQAEKLKFFVDLVQEWSKKLANSLAPPLQ